MKTTLPPGCQLIFWSEHYFDGLWLGSCLQFTESRQVVNSYRGTLFTWTIHKRELRLLFLWAYGLQLCGTIDEYLIIVLHINISKKLLKDKLSRSDWTVECIDHQSIARDPSNGGSLLECSIYNILRVSGSAMFGADRRSRNSCTTREWEVSNNMLKYLTGQWNQGIYSSTYFQQLYKHIRTVILIKSMADRRKNIKSSLFYYYYNRVEAMKQHFFE